MNNNKFYKIAKIAAGVLGLIGVIMLVRVLMPGDEVLKSDEDVQSSVLDPFVSFTIFMLYLTTGIAILFSIWNLITHPAALKKAIISLVALGVLFAIAYGVSSDAEVTGAGGVSIKDGAAGAIPKMVGTLINYTYILGVIGLITCLLYTSPSPRDS